MRFKEALFLMIKRDPSRRVGMRLTIGPCHVAAAAGTLRWAVPLPAPDPLQCIHILILSRCKVSCTCCCTDTMREIAMAWTHIWVEPLYSRSCWWICTISVSVYKYVSQSTVFSHSFLGRGLCCRKGEWTYLSPVAVKEVPLLAAPASAGEHAFNPCISRNSSL